MIGVGVSQEDGFNSPLVEKCITRRARPVGSAACGHNISCGETEKVAGQVGKQPACGGMDRCR